MKMNKDRMRFVLGEAVEVVEDLLLDMGLTDSEVYDFILNKFGIDDDEYTYIKGGR